MRPWYDFNHASWRILLCHIWQDRMDIRKFHIMGYDVL